MDAEYIAALIMSGGALVGVGLQLYKARQEQPKVSADTGNVNVETIQLLSVQLNEAHKELATFRLRLDKMEQQDDYVAYLLRGIGRLIAGYTAHDMTVPWQPISFEQFVKIKENGGSDAL